MTGSESNNAGSGKRDNMINKKKSRSTCHVGMRILDFLLKRLGKICPKASGVVLFYSRKEKSCGGECV